MIIHELNFFKVYSKINKIEKNQQHIEDNQHQIATNMMTIKRNRGRLDELEDMTGVRRVTAPTARNTWR